MTIEVESTHSGDSQLDGADSIENLFLKRMTEDEETLSEGDAEENLETTSNEDEAESEDEATLSDDEAEESNEEPVETEDTDKPARKKIEATDEDVIEVEGVEVSLRDLKRNYGRDKALTLKEQAASEKTKQAEEAAHLHASSLKRHYDRAVQRYRQYEGVNLVVLSQREGWDADTLETVMNQERDAWADVEFFETELRDLSQRRTVETNARIQREAQEAFKVLSNPETGIKDWSLNTYNTLITYAENDLGIAPEFVRNLTDPTLIKVLHKLHAYEKGATVSAKTLEAKTRKPAPVAAPKVLKSSASNAPKSSDEERAIRRLKSDNSSDAIQEAFMARLGLR